MSANGKRDHDPFIPAELRTVSAMMEAGVHPTGYCGACKTGWPLDLAKIAKRRGPFWTLYGRRLRCIHCRREASILAKGQGGFTWPISGEACANYTDARLLRSACPWCGKTAHGHQP